MHNEALTKIILLNTALLIHETNKSRYNDGTIITIVITATADAKVVTTTHRHHCKCNYSPATAFLGS